MRALSALCVLLLVIPAWAQKPPKPFVDRHLGISYTPPAGWQPHDPGELTTNPMNGLQAAYSGPVYDGVSPAIFWAAFSGDFVALSEEFVEQRLTPLFQKTFPGFEVTGTARITVAGRDAVSIAGTFTEETKAIRCRQIFIPYQGHLFTFWVLAGETGFPQAANAFEKMIKSVRFLPRNNPPPSDPDGTPAPPKPYVDRQLGITYLPPAGWRVGAARSSATMRVSYSAPASSRAIARIEWGDIRAPVNRLNQLPPETPSLLEDLHRKSHPDYRIADTARIRVGGREALRLDGSWTTEGILLRNRQIVVLHQGRMVLFLLMAEASTYPEALGDFEKMIKSVRFLPRNSPRNPNKVKEAGTKPYAGAAG